MFFAPCKADDTCKSVPLDVGNSVSTNRTRRAYRAGSGQVASGDLSTIFSDDLAGVDQLPA
jgi:hypothetical protein